MKAIYSQTIGGINEFVTKGIIERLPTEDRKFIDSLANTLIENIKKKKGESYNIGIISARCLVFSLVAFISRQNQNVL